MGPFLTSDSMCRKQIAVGLVVYGSFILPEKDEDRFLEINSFHIVVVVYVWFDCVEQPFR